MLTMGPIRDTIETVIKKGEKMYKKTRKDFQGYKWMNSGSGVYRKHINEKDFGASCWIWLGIIALVGIIIGLQ